MNFRVLEERDKCVVTLHMSVFNPEHTLHPPGHAVHMSGNGTTASCQCLIPSWICLNQTHAWMDICAQRLWCTRQSSDYFILTISRRKHTHTHWCHLRSSWQCWSTGSHTVFAMILHDTLNILCEGVALRGTWIILYVIHQITMSSSRCVTTTTQHLSPPNILPHAIFSHYSGLETGVSLWLCVYARCMNTTIRPWVDLCLFFWQVVLCAVCECVCVLS